MTDEWLQRRFPGGGTAQERIRRLLPRRLLVVAVGLVALLAAAFLVAPWLPVYDGRGAKVIAIALAALGLVSGVIFLLAVVRQATRQARRPADPPLLPALSWAERRELLDELHGRRQVVPGDEAALAALVRARQQSSTMGWLGVGQLCGASSALLREQDRFLATVFIATVVIGVAVFAFALRARADVRAAERITAAASS